MNKGILSRGSILVIILLLVNVIGAGFTSAEVVDQVITEVGVTDVAYNSAANEYLVVFEVSNGTDRGIYACRVDYEGNIIGSQQELVALTSSTPKHPKVTYNSVNDEYLVVYGILGQYEIVSESSIVTINRIQGITVSLDSSTGLTLGTPAYMDELQLSNSTNPSAGSRGTPEVSYSKDNNSYAVVWVNSETITDANQQTTTTKDLEGSIIYAVTSPSAILNFGDASGLVGEIDISYNSSDYTHSVVYEMSVNEDSQIYMSEFDKYGGSMVNELNISAPLGGGQAYHTYPSVVHNTSNSDEFVTWIDSNREVVGVIGAYKSATSSAIEVGTDVTVDSNGGLSTLSKGQMTSEVFSVWADNYRNEVPLLYGQWVDANGALTGSQPITISSSNSTYDYLAAASNGYDAHLISYALGSSAVGVTKYGAITNGTLQFRSSTLSVTEGDNVTVKIKRLDGVDGQVTVDYTTANGSASASDYTALTGTSTFENGQVLDSITIATTADGIVEGTETITVTLSNVTGGALIGSKDVVTINIVDPESYVDLSTNSVSVTEGGATALTVNRTGVLTATDTIDYTTTNGTAGSKDYTTTSGTLTFAPGVGSAEIPLTTTQDAIYEGNEVFYVSLSQPAGYATLGTITQTAVTIVEDDIMPQFDMASSTATVQEGSNIALTVNRSGSTASTDSIQYQTSFGTADSTDFTAVSGTLTFSPEETSKSIPISTTSDLVYESSETFTVTLSQPSTFSGLGSSTSTTVTISNDDVMPQYEMAASSVTVQEGSEASIVVNRIGNTAATDTVQYQTSIGTAGETDYVAVTTPVTLTFNPGETSKTISVATTEDILIEGDETFSVKLTQPGTGSGLGSTTSTTVTITDNDVMPEFSFAASTASVQEGETVTVTVNRTGSDVFTNTIEYQTSTGSASSSDFSAASGTLTFASGETSKTIIVSTTEDSTVEGNESFTISLSVPSSGAGLGTIYTTTITITDDDVQTSSGGGGSSSSGGSTTTPQQQEDTSSEKDVENLTNALEDTGKTTEDAGTLLNVIEDNIGTIEDETVLTNTLTTYVETIDDIAEIGENSEDPEWVEEQIIQISTVVSDSIQNIEDDESIIEIANAVLTQIETIETTTDFEQSAELKNQIADLAQSVLTKVSEIEIEPKVDVVNGVSEVSFDQQALADTIAQKAANFKALSDSFNAFYGDSNVREFDFEVTLVTEQVGNQVQVPIDPETIETLNNAGVDALSVAVGGTSITMDKEVFTGEGGDAGEELIVDMNFNGQGFEVRDENINFKSGHITDVRVFKGDEEKKKLDKPVSLSFDLTAFEFWDENPTPGSLSIFRLNEETGEWEPVGGVHNPITNTIETKRLTLSQYTVMQSNKSFSDVENSWAKDEINELLGKGIIDDTETFNPEETISREEFTTWVARAYGVVDENADAPITDVSATHDHFKELASAYNAGIISGNGDGSINPNAAITKEQMSAILANAMTQYDDMKLNEGLTGTLASASDADLISEWAGDDIAMLVELGVIDNSSGAIDPQQQLTKEEAAAILKKIYG